MAKQAMRHFGGSTAKAAPVGNGAASKPKGSKLPAAKSGGARHFGGSTMKAAPVGKGPAKAPKGHAIKSKSGVHGAISFSKKTAPTAPAMRYPQH